MYRLWWILPISLLLGSIFAAYQVYVYCAVIFPLSTTVIKFFSIQLAAGALAVCLMLLVLVGILKPDNKGGG
jgi:hypothetical protein